MELECGLEFELLEHESGTGICFRDILARFHGNIAMPNLLGINCNHFYQALRTDCHILRQ